MRYYDLANPAHLSAALLPDLVLMGGAMLLLLVAVWRRESAGHQRIVGVLSIGLSVVKSLKALTLIECSRISLTEYHPKISIACGGRCGAWLRARRRFFEVEELFQFPIHANVDVHHDVDRFDLDRIDRKPRARTYKRQEQHHDRIDRPFTLQVAPPFTGRYLLPAEIF